MSTYRTYYDLSDSKDYGIYRRVNSKTGETTIYIFEEYVPGKKPGDPLTLSQYKDHYWPDGDDRWYNNHFDEEDAPDIVYERIDDIANIAKYL